MEDLWQYRGVQSIPGRSPRTQGSGEYLEKGVQTGRKRREC